LKIILFFWLGWEIGINKRRNCFSPNLSPKLKFFPNPFREESAQLRSENLVIEKGCKKILVLEIMSKLVFLNAKFPHPKKN